MAGGFPTVNAVADDVPPPAPGLDTVTEAPAGAVRFAAGSRAQSWLSEMYSVRRAVPFHCTTEFSAKLEPVSVTRTSELPTATLDGLTDVRDGAADCEEASRVRQLYKAPLITGAAEASSAYGTSAIDTRPVAKFSPEPVTPVTGSSFNLHQIAPRKFGFIAICCTFCPQKTARATWVPTFVIQPVNPPRSIAPKS